MPLILLQPSPTSGRHEAVSLSRATLSAHQAKHAAEIQIERHIVAA